MSGMTALPVLPRRAVHKPNEDNKDALPWSFLLCKALAMAWAGARRRGRSARYLRGAAPQGRVVDVENVYS